MTRRDKIKMFIIGYLSACGTLCVLSAILAFWGR